MCLPLHAVVGQAGRRARSSQMLLVLYSLATLPVEVTLPLPLTRVDTARCEGLVRHPVSVSEKSRTPSCSGDTPRRRGGSVRGGELGQRYAARGRTRPD